MKIDVALGDRAYPVLIGSGLLARAAGVEKIDAGPAAIALTPKGRQAPPGVDGLVEKNGRWLLAERIADERARVERVAEVLGELVE